MSGFWLVSYVLLWILVLGLFLIVIGLLQQVGMLQRQLAQIGTDAKGSFANPIPEPENDGPALGSSLPELQMETFNGLGTLLLPDPHNSKDTLFVFLSPTCELCQEVVEPLNSLVDGGLFRGNVVVLMKSDEQACRAFLSIFPLHVPVVCDSRHQIIIGFDVHNIPSGLLYDVHGMLKQKGLVGNRDDLLMLIRDVPVSLPE